MKYAYAALFLLQLDNAASLQSCSRVRLKFQRAVHVMVPLTGQHMLLVVHLIHRALSLKNKRADVMRQSRRLRCTAIAVQ